MTVGHLGMKHPSLAALVDAIKSKISRESLHERFTESAALFIEVCTQFVLRNKFQIPPLYTKLLKNSITYLSLIAVVGIFIPNYQMFYLVAEAALPMQIVKFKHFTNTNRVNCLL